MAEISRRKFIQLTVLSSAVAATGCKVNLGSNKAIYKSEVTGQYGGYDNRVEPYINQPDGLQDGVPQYFATTCQMCPAGCGLYVRTMDGRAHKIEGNPTHPVSGGKTCARGQASLQHLYSPTRVRFPRSSDAHGDIDWEIALTRTADALKTSGKQTAILVDAMTIGHSPTMQRLVTEFAASLGASIANYSLIDDTPWRAAIHSVYGHNQLPAYQLDQADVLLAFSANFLEAWPSPVYYNRLFGEFRQGPRRAQGQHGRFIYIGPRMSMTAAKADQWIPCNPNTEGIVAQGILTALGGPGIPIARAAEVSGVSEQQLTAIAREFGSAGTRALAMGGDILLGGPNATLDLTAVELLNTHVKSPYVQFGASSVAINPISPYSSFDQMQSLTKAMQLGRINALLVLGMSNPAFTLPQALGFTEALAHVPFVAALSPFTDETTDQAHIILPTRTFLEEWGDNVPLVIPSNSRGASLRQPVIDPQFVSGFGQVHDKPPHIPWMDTRPLGDILIDLAKRVGKPMSEPDLKTAIRRTWAKLGQADLTVTDTSNDAKWVNAVSNAGAWTKSKEPPPTRPIAPTLPDVLGMTRAPAKEDGTFALQLFPHLYYGDGRHANLGWMQEIPDPMTSAVWNSWVEINMQTAHALGIRTGDIVKLTTQHGSIEVPAVPYPGIHPNVIAMPIGQGHTSGSYGGNVGKRGVNPLAILDPTGDSQNGTFAYNATRVQLTKIRDAAAGYHPEQNTLVLVQDRPGGQEPAAVQDLIHTTAKEWKTAKPVTGAPQGEQSIFSRRGKTPIKEVQ